MRIQNQPQASNVDRASVRQVSAAKATATEAESAVTKGGAAGTEKVTVSAEAQKLADAKGAHVEKMERLRASLADGSFKVDAEAIASKLVGEGE